MQDLDDLIPIERVMELRPARTKVTIRPLRTRQLSPVAKALSKLPPHVVGAIESGSFDVREIMEHVDVVCEALVAATDVSAKDLGEADPDDTARLAAACFEVNVDFFLERMAPALQEIAALAIRVMNQAGPSSSSGSSPTATAETRS